MEHDFGKLHMYEACMAYIRADRVLRTLLNGLLSEHQITMQEWLLLGVVEQGPKSGITLSNIASALDVSQPQVTALMDRAISRGLVRQKVHKQDRRSRTVVLTIKGKRLLDSIEEGVEVFMKTWLSEIPDQQLKHYATTVARIANYKLPA